jgi:hypothetical protein
MPVRPSSLIDTSRPDNTQAVVGSDGEIFRVDAARQVIRVGIGGEEADWGPGQADITDSEIQIANPSGVGGTSELSGVVRSLDSENCSIAIIWEGEDTNVTSISEGQNSDTALVEQPPELQNDTAHTIEAVTTKADHCTIIVEDGSPGGTTNNIEYTLNFH